MTKTIPAEPEQLYNFARRQFPDQRAVIGCEDGPTGFGLYDYLTGHDMSCFVIAPASVRKAMHDPVKTNRLDARKFSNMLAEGDFHPVRVPDGPCRELRNFVQIRRVMLICSAHPNNASKRYYWPTACTLSAAMSINTGPIFS